MIIIFFVIIEYDIKETDLMLRLGLVHIRWIIIWYLHYAFFSFFQVRLQKQHTTIIPVAVIRYYNLQLAS